MMNFQQARENMVDCQIHPLGVVSESILKSYQSIPREMFVPDHMQDSAYIDEDLSLGGGRFLIEPQVHARLIQALQLTSEDVVLDIAGATGYSAAILSPIVSTVIAIEESPEFLEQAHKNWEKLSLCNIAAFQGSFKEGGKEYAPFSAILMNGAVGFMPREILNQLKEGGRLVAVVRENPNQPGKAILFQRTSEDVFSEQVLFDAFIPYLPNFEPKHDFIF